LAEKKKFFEKEYEASKTQKNYGIALKESADFLYIPL
jgi:hypothetical protein